MFVQTWEKVLTLSFVTEKFPMLIKTFCTYALFWEYFFFCDKWRTK
jgi:hypothetical protein